VSTRMARIVPQAAGGENGDYRRPVPMTCHRHDRRY